VENNTNTDSPQFIVTLLRGWILKPAKQEACGRGVSSLRKKEQLIKDVWKKFRCDLEKDKNTLAVL
jgi:hypothetical protein